MAFTSFQRRAVVAATLVSRTATLTKTEAGDTFASVATLALQATAGVTEAGDSLSSSSVHAIAATVSATEAGDSSTAAGALALNSSISGTEAGDTLASSGTLPLTGTGEIQEGTDVPSFIGALAIVGSAAESEGSDTISSQGNVDIIASSALVDTGDSLTASATLPIAALQGPAEDNDVVASTAVLPILAAVAEAEPTDTFASAALLEIGAVAALAETSDGFGATGAFDVLGSVAVSEAADTFVSSSTLVVGGQSALAEAGDVLSASGTLETLGGVGGRSLGLWLWLPVGLPVEPGLGVTEVPDGLSADGTLVVAASASLEEQGDTVFAIGGAVEPGASGLPLGPWLWLPVSTALGAGQSIVVSQEGPDALSSTAFLPIIGEFDRLETADSSLIGGLSIVTGILTATDAGDNLSTSGVLPITGRLTVVRSFFTADSNLISADSTTRTVDESGGVLAIPDMLSTGGTVPTQADLQITEAADTANSFATIFLAGAFVVEDLDTLTFTGQIAISGSAALSEVSGGPGALLGPWLWLPVETEAEVGHDTVFAEAELTIFGITDKIEDADVLAGSGGLDVTASAGLTEADDTAQAAGIIETIADMDASEEPDGLASTLQIVSFGFVDSIEGADAGTSIALHRPRRTTATRGAAAQYRSRPRNIVSVGTRLNVQDSSVRRIRSS